MDAFRQLLPLAIPFLVIYFFVRRHNKKAGPEGPGPNGEVPYGVRGWLTFYVVTSISLGPLITLSKVISSIMEAESKYPGLLNLDGWGAYKKAAWITTLLLIAWQIWVAFELKNKWVPRSVTRAKVFLVLAPLIAFVADAIQASMFLNVTPGGEAVGGILAAAIVSSIWFAYFHRSKRVRNTYGLAKQKQQPTPAPAPIPPELVPESVPARSPKEIGSLESRLQTLKDLRERGLISESDYKEKKAELIKAL